MVKITNNTLSHQLIEAVNNFYQLNEAVDNTDHYVNVYDWKCDYINNKIITTINSNDTGNMNIIIREIWANCANCNMVRISFSEYEGKIYAHVIVVADCLTMDYDYYIIKLINGTYVIKYHNNDDNSDIFNRKNLAIKRNKIDKIAKLKVHTNIFTSEYKDSLFDYRTCRGQINENLYYKIVSHP